VSILPSIVSPQTIKDGFQLAHRAVAAFEAMAQALARQADVMESDVEADRPESIDSTWVRRYGEALVSILDTDGNSQLEKARKLRHLAATMTKHDKKTEAQIR
jgi:hypothetical protein